ncbi:hypothetical protein PSPO01_07260 [Paraphaeosphaeria sporulosa]
MALHRNQLQDVVLPPNGRPIRHRSRRVMAMVEMEFRLLARVPALARTPKVFQHPRNTLGRDNIHACAPH